MLLIITNRTDLATDFLILRLHELKISYLRFNTEDFPQQAMISIEYSSKQWRWAIELQGKIYRDFEFSGVYLRHPGIAAIESVDDEHKEFAEGEVAETLRSLWRVIPDNLWLNNPRKVWQASNKITQLLTAGDLGFNIPATLITNSQVNIKKFIGYHSDERMVMKAVKHGFISNNDGTWLAGTQAFVLEDLMQKGTASDIPTQIQQRIIKKCDIRVVVVDNDVFPTRIFSNDNSDTWIDWRIEELSCQQLRHESFTLSPKLESLCIELPRRMGLRYSSMDLIEDQKGEFWFLELNPNGQWAWIEQLTGSNIRDAIIRAFRL